MDKGYGQAFYQLAGYYSRGSRGLPQDDIKANDLLLKAGEFGFARGYYNLGIAYNNHGLGVDVDRKKAMHYYELAAINGHTKARHILGCMEGESGNEHRAIKHHIIAARAGYEESLEGIQLGFKEGLVTKDEYASTLRVYQKMQDEIKSDARDKAEAIARRAVS